MLTESDKPIIRAMILERVRLRKSTGCWIWYGKALNNNGTRPCLNYRGKHHGVNRLSAWIWLGMSLTNGDQANHGPCNNSMCVRPTHLYIGDQAQNNRDISDRGTVRVIKKLGEQHGNSRFTEADIHTIRKLRKQGVPLKELATTYSTTKVRISQIALGKAWSHLTGDWVPDSRRRKL